MPKSLAMSQVPKIAGSIDDRHYVKPAIISSRSAGVISDVAWKSAVGPEIDAQVTGKKQLKPPARDASILAFSLGWVKTSPIRLK